MVGSSFGEEERELKTLKMVWSVSRLLVAPKAENEWFSI